MTSILEIFPQKLKNLERMKLVAEPAADEVETSLLLDLLLRGGGRDVLNVNSVAHVCGCECEYV